MAVTLPKIYQFIFDIGTLPKMVQISLELYGMHEHVGKGSNPAIIQMAKDLGVANIYKDDDESWCALVHCWICLKAGKSMPFKSYQILRAASFSEWGSPVARGDEMFGDTGVFKRPGGHHVGIIIAESEKSFFILGGNQGNQHCIMEISKLRLIACRREYTIGPPASVKKYVLDSSGKFSTNEA